ncbi:hypothetical protein [Planomonospora algeriensis]
MGQDGREHRAGLGDPVRAEPLRQLGVQCGAVGAGRLDGGRAVRREAEEAGAGVAGGRPYGRPRPGRGAAVPLFGNGLFPLDGSSETASAAPSSSAYISTWTGTWILLAIGV